MKNEQDFIEYTILLLGESRVGKTSIFNRYIYNKFVDNVSSTIGVDFETKTLLYKGKNYSIKLYDTAGQERFRGIARSYYHFGKAFLIIFDLSNEHSLYSIENWLDSIKQEVNDYKFLIIGNKDDLSKDKKIPDQIIYEHLKDYKKQFIKTSALKNINIDKAIMKIIDIMEDEDIYLDNKDEEKVFQTVNTIKIQNKKDKHKDNATLKKEKCC